MIIYSIEYLSGVIALKNLVFIKDKMVYTVSYLFVIFKMFIIFTYLISITLPCCPELPTDLFIVINFHLVFNITGIFLQIVRVSKNFPNHCL